MGKKANYWHINEPQLISFCAANNLIFQWKKSSEGMARIYSDEVECYVWMQRLTIELRKQNGIYLAKSKYFRNNMIFNKRTFSNILFGSSKSKMPQVVPRFRGGVTVIRIKEGTSPDKRLQLINQARLISKRHSTLYV